MRTMRTINKQGRHAGGAQIAAMTVRQTLRNLGVKEFPGNVGGWRSRLSLTPSAGNQAIRLLGRVDEPSILDLRSSNDAGAEPTWSDFGGYAGIPAIEHSSAITYVSSCRPNRHLIYVSPQISNLGFVPEDLLGRPDLRLQQVHEEDFGRFDQALRHSCNAAENFICHYRLYDSQGKVRWFHDEATVVCDEAGVPLFIKGVMLDISDKKRMEAELVDHRYCLERNVEQRTRLQTKRIATLESCNASLCDQLSSARQEIAALKQMLRLAVPESCPESGEDCSADMSSGL